MEDRHAPSSCIFYKGKTNNLAVRWMFDGLFREYGVDLVLQGHEHNYARMTNKNDEGRNDHPVVSGKPRFPEELPSIFQ